MGSSPKQVTKGDTRDDLVAVLGAPAWRRLSASFGTGGRQASLARRGSGIHAAVGTCLHTSPHLSYHDYHTIEGKKGHVKAR